MIKHAIGSTVYTLDGQLRCIEKCTMLSTEERHGETYYYLSNFFEPIHEDDVFVTPEAVAEDLLNLFYENEEIEEGGF